VGVEFTRRRSARSDGVAVAIRLPDPYDAGSLRPDTVRDVRANLGEGRADFTGWDGAFETSVASLTNQVLIPSNGGGFASAMAMAMAMAMALW